MMKKYVALLLCAGFALAIGSVSADEMQPRFSPSSTNTLNIANPLKPVLRSEYEYECRPAGSNVWKCSHCEHDDANQMSTCDEWFMYGNRPH